MSLSSTYQIGYDCAGLEAAALGLRQIASEMVQIRDSLVFGFGRLALNTAGEFSDAASFEAQMHIKRLDDQIEKLSSVAGILDWHQRSMQDISINALARIRSIREVASQ
jgi:hypothetical protein